MNVTISRRTLAVVAVVVVLVVAGVVTWLVLGTGDRPVASTAAAPTSQARTAGEAAFLDAVKTSKAALSDDDALQAGQYNCKSWDKLRVGDVPDPVPAPYDIDALAKEGKLTVGQVRDIEYAAVHNLCPSNVEFYTKH